MTSEVEAGSKMAALHHEPLEVVRVQPDDGWTAFKGKSVAHLAGQLLVIRLPAGVCRLMNAP